MKDRRRHENAEENTDSQQRVAERAYELFLQRGQEPGHELEDWLQAEREIQGATRTQHAR